LLGGHIAELQIGSQIEPTQLGQPVGGVPWVQVPPASTHIPELVELVLLELVELLVELVELVVPLEVVLLVVCAPLELAVVELEAGPCSEPLEVVVVLDALLVPPAPAAPPVAISRPLSWATIWQPTARAGRKTAAAIVR
jgi:hypothetical protein